MVTRRGFPQILGFISQIFSIPGIRYRTLGLGLISQPVSYSDRRGLVDEIAYLIVIFGYGEILHTFSTSILELIIPSNIPATISYLAWNTAIERLLAGVFTESWSLFFDVFYLCCHCYNQCRKIIQAQYISLLSLLKSITRWSLSYEFILSLQTIYYKRDCVTCDLTHFHSITSLAVIKMVNGRCFRV